MTFHSDTPLSGKQCLKYVMAEALMYSNEDGASLHNQHRSKLLSQTPAQWCRSLVCDNRHANSCLSLQVRLRRALKTIQNDPLLPAQIHAYIGAVE